MASVEDRLFLDPPAFDFFQAVRVLSRLDPSRRPVGQAGPPRDEVVRFRAHLACDFPPSSIYDLQPPSRDLTAPLMTVTFFGLYGPSGILPRHYTDYLFRLQREAKGQDKHALRAWLDLFNHRLISLFYRAWEKYRFPLAYESGAFAQPEPDPFTRAVFSLVGLGMPPLRDRLRVACRERVGGRTRERVLARIDDLAVLYYAGLLARRPRSAVGLRQILEDFFDLPVQVQQFHGRWMAFEESSRWGLGEANSRLGVDAVAGERVFDVQSKLRLRIGPLAREQFDEFLPDKSPSPKRKAMFLLTHLARLYLGPAVDFDVQVVLRAQDVPPCRMRAGAGAGLGPRLGWNTWLCTHTAERDADDAVFEGDEVYWVDARPAPSDAPESEGVAPAPDPDALLRTIIVRLKKPR
jgi:type VI secretion system protein ImpH